MPAKLNTKERLILIKRVVNGGEGVSKVCSEAGISRTIFYRWLQRYKKNNKKFHSVAPKGNRPLGFKHALNISPKDKLIMIKRVEDGESVARVCKLYNVSRTVFYRWQKRYFEAKEGQKLEALWEKKPKLSKYFNQSPEEYSNAVLAAVKAYPELSSHKLVYILPQVGGKPILGNHGVQNILRRHDLSTYDKRLSYSLNNKNWLQMHKFLELFKGIISFVGSQNTPVRQFIVRSSFTIFIALLIGTVFYGASSLYGLIFGPTNFTLTIGIAFSLVSLFFGMFFFIYSLKYYLTIAIVLSFSRHSEEKKGSESRKSFFERLFSQGSLSASVKAYKEYKCGGGLLPDLSKIILKRKPFVSIHLATYNEKRVLNRLLTAVTSMDYENYEVIIVDDSTDDTIEVLNQWRNHPRLKIIHRQSRSGFKGGALQEALKISNPKAEFVLVFDADFIPYPDTITQFLKYFQNTTGNLDPRVVAKSKIAAVQGYQWHVLNKSENWVTRGVRSEYAGSYVIERSGEEIYSGLKQIAGSVYMIRADVLKRMGWGTSITEDFQLTLRLYEQGYKVVYTPYIQAPAEAVSTIKRLIRQRMRWAEGHSHNVKLMFLRLLIGRRIEEQGLALASHNIKYQISKTKIKLLSLSHH